jgi:hypothetical protein
LGPARGDAKAGAPVYRVILPILITQVKYLLKTQTTKYGTKKKFLRSSGSPLTQLARQVDFTRPINPKNR